MKIDQQELNVKKRAIELSSLFGIFNFALLLLTPISYIILSDSNAFISSSVIFWTSFLSLLNLAMLYVYKKNKDPFVLILVFNTIAFYQFRVFNLIWYSYFGMIPDYFFEPNSLTSTLLFILLSNLSIFLGILLVKPLPQLISLPKDLKGINQNILAPCSVMIISIVLICFFKHTYLITFISNTFVYYPAILILFLTFFILCSDYLNNKRRLLLFFCLALFIIFLTVLGVRSAVLQILSIFFIINLALNKKIQISYSLLSKIFFIFIPISIIIFSIATNLRGYGYDTTSKIDLIRIEGIKSAIHLSPELFAKLFDRLGFLTYCQKITDLPSFYSKFISLKYYSYSVLDNITPGFNFFDAPKASNVLHLINNSLTPAPTFKEVLDDYHSDMFTVYAEYKILFGYFPALLMFLISGYFFKKMYLYVNQKNWFDSLLLRILVINFFYIWLNSFGLDWQVIEGLSILITTLIFKSFFNPYKKVC